MGDAAVISTSEEPRPRALGPFGRRSFRVGRVFDIDIGFDASWLVIFVLVTVALASKFGLEHEAWSKFESWGAGLAASLIFFLSIVLHELGHSLTSKALGLSVRSITLFIFGGVALLEGKPKRPRDEFLIGVAGPVVSVLLGVVFLGLAAVIPETTRPGAIFVAIFDWLGFVNLVLAGFNLFPGHPLDGGHLLRAVVWAMTGKERAATAVASLLGTLFAMVLMFGGALSIVMFGQLGGFWLVIIGWFLKRAAQNAVFQEVLEERLSGVTATESMEEDCPRAAADASVEELIADAILHKGERYFCVEEGGVLTGLVTLTDVKAVRPEDRTLTSVGSIMVPREKLVTIAGSDSLWDALRRMDDFRLNQIPVTGDGGRLIGVLTRERLLHVIRNQMDLGRNR